MARKWAPKEPKKNIGAILRETRALLCRCGHSLVQHAPRRGFECNKCDDCAEFLRLVADRPK